MTKALQALADDLAPTTFLGGPPAAFEAIGRLQLITLLRCGLYPHSKVLDIGCGCLRGGYWLMHFLNADCYCGIEPNRQMLQTGLDTFIDKATVETKRPRFAFNDQFDPSEFGEVFDCFVARSVWTHASKNQIETMLDMFDMHGSSNAMFLTSYLPAPDAGYMGDEWVGRSHSSDVGGMIKHGLSWIRERCESRKMKVEELAIDHIIQPWLLISKGDGDRPMKTFLQPLHK